MFSLLQQVVKRLAREGDGHLVKATLCLLEVSKSGLLETELLDLLGDEENLIHKRKTKDCLSKYCPAIATCNVYSLATAKLLAYTK